MTEAIVPFSQPTPTEIVIHRPPSVLSVLGLDSIVPKYNTMTYWKVKDRFGYGHNMAALLLDHTLLENTKPGGSALFLGIQYNPTKQPVGYLCLSLPPGERKAHGDGSLFCNIKKGFYLPSVFLDLRNRWPFSSVGMRIDAEYEGRGLGSLLWAVSLGILDSIGRNACVVLSDITDKDNLIARRQSQIRANSKQPHIAPTGSFYGYRNTTQEVWPGYYILSTRPTPEQQILMAHLIVDPVPALGGKPLQLS